MGPSSKAAPAGDPRELPRKNPAGRHKALTWGWGRHSDTGQHPPRALSDSHRREPVGKKVSLAPTHHYHQCPQTQESEDRPWNNEARILPLTQGVSSYRLFLITLHGPEATRQKTDGAFAVALRCSEEIVTFVSYPIHNKSHRYPTALPTIYR